jgi:hypothetical protein
VSQESLMVALDELGVEVTFLDRSSRLALVGNNMGGGEEGDGALAKLLGHLIDSLSLRNEGCRRSCTWCLDRSFETLNSFLLCWGHLAEEFSILQEAGGEAMLLGKVERMDEVDMDMDNALGKGNGPWDNLQGGEEGGHCSSSFHTHTCMCALPLVSDHCLTSLPSLLRVASTKLQPQVYYT